MPGGSVIDNDVTLLKGGVATGPNKAAVAIWSTVFSLISYTWSGADLAGFAAVDFNAANFGVQLSTSATGNFTAEVDYIQVTVNYTAGSGPQSQCAMTGAGK